MNIRLNKTRKNVLNRNAFIISGYSVLSAEGFHFLILPVQLTPFPVYPGLHVQMKEPLVLLQKALESQ